MALVATLAPAARAQSPVPGRATQTLPQPLTLERALQYAIEHYPSVRAAIEEINASAAGIDAARSAYLPRLDAVWQANRATANNLFGQLLPQSVIPPLTGPVLATASGESIWGTAAGAFFSWEAVDFGLRRAGVDRAEAALARARAGETVTRLDVQTAVANAFLAVAAAERTVAAAQADVDRRDVLMRSVQALVDNQLRPGADASRAEAERAAAETRLIQARQALALAQAALGQVLGTGQPVATIDDGALLARLPSRDIPPAAPAGHPLAQLRQTAIDEARALEAVLARTDRPHLFLQSAVFARGSGAAPTGTLDGGLSGLAFDRANWAAGVQVVLPNVFDLPSLHARQAAALASERAESARYDEALLTVASRQQAAAALVEAARAVAANTPVQLAAARQTEAQARARYQAGLATIVEVADAQSLLAQAEVQDQLARIDVWRALLQAAAARGDLAPFLDLVRQP